MFVLITYDVSTASPAGQKRLRSVAKLCERYGFRVQNSVFEVLLDNTSFTLLKKEIESVIDPALDSVRFYRLGNNYKPKITFIGKAPSVQAGEPLIF